MNKAQLETLHSLLEMFRHDYNLDSMMDNVYIAYLLKAIEKEEGKT